MKKKTIRSYKILAIYGGCTQCDGELVTEDGSFMLTPQDDCSGEIKCQDCETVHVFPDKMFQSYGPQHKSL
tara:strand:+ start:259 stop:471 length:213 start_codon:yes stop_codon:yes gene_type:complete